MRPILRAITISTVIVVVYPFVVVALAWPLAVLWGRPFGNTAYKAMMMPLELPVFVMRLLNGSRDLGGRMPIEVLILTFGWYFASNAAIYYPPRPPVSRVARKEPEIAVGHEGAFGGLPRLPGAEGP